MHTIMMFMLSGPDSVACAADGHRQEHCLGRVRVLIRQRPAGLCGRCVAVTDEGLEAVGQHCRQLRVLRLYANSGITDVGVKAIANLPHLEVKSLLSC